MALLTSSQLTFYETKDSYNIVVSPDCIALECDKDGNVLQTKTFTITYGTYLGTTRVKSKSFVVNNVPSNITVTNQSNATASADGQISVAISSNCNLDGAQAGTFYFEVLSDDDDQFCFRKYITLVKSVVGATGEQGTPGISAVQFGIYCADGDTFENQSGSKTLQTYAFNGINEIADGQYTWYYSNNGNWTQIDTELSTVTVQKNVFNANDAVVKNNISISAGVQSTVEVANGTIDTTTKLPDLGKTNVTFTDVSAQPSWFIISSRDEFDTQWTRCVYSVYDGSKHFGTYYKTNLNYSESYYHFEYTASSSSLNVWADSVDNGGYMHNVTNGAGYRLFYGYNNQLNTSTNINVSADKKSITINELSKQPDYYFLVGIKNNPTQPFITDVIHYSIVKNNITETITYGNFVNSGQTYSASNYTPNYNSGGSSLTIAANENGGQFGTSDSYVFYYGYNTIQTTTTTSGGKVQSTSGHTSLVIPVTPNKTYSLTIPNANHSLVVGNSSSTFNVGTSYNQIYTTDGSTYPISFTTPNNINYILVYCSSNTYNYDSNKSNIQLKTDVEVETGADSLIVQGEDVYNSQTYKCILNVDGKNYEAYYTLNDITDIYQSEIRTLNGNTISSSNPYIVAYAALLKNGVEVDELIGDIFVKTSENDVPSSDGENQYYYVIDDTNQTIELKYYNGTTWTNPQMSQQYQYNWHKVIGINGYEDSGMQSKVALFTSRHISNSVTVGCSILDSNNAVVSLCQTEMLDLNDPITSSSQPINVRAGQLWVDTSDTPYTIKIYDGTQWVMSKAHSDTNTNVFTSKPDTKLSDGYCYHQGDIWVVSESDVSDTFPYSANTMLICKNTSVEYSDDDWTELYNSKINDLKKRTDNLEQHVKAESDGLYLNGTSSQGKIPFYAKLTSNELGFYERNSTESNDDDGTKVAWIGNENMHAKETIIEGALAVVVKGSSLESDKLSSSTSSAFIQIGDFKIQFESNGSLSII